MDSTQNVHRGIVVKKVISAVLFLGLLLCLAVPTFALDVRNSLEGEFEDEATGQYLPYRLIVPEIYDEKYVFPLVVFFHGAGERGLDNAKQLDNCVQMIADNMPKAIILAPQCDSMSRWVETDWIQGCYSVDEIDESDEMIAVMKLIDEIKQEYSIDERSVYAMGISMGGFAVWDAMVRHNDVFAAGVACCGAGDPSKAEVLKDTPMFVFHGGQDDVVPVTGSTEMVEAIQAVGGTRVQYKEYAGDGHGIWDTVYSLETLYKDVQKCHLSEDKLATKNHQDTEPQNHDLLMYILIGAGVVVVATVPIVIIAVKKKKEKNEV